MTRRQWTSLERVLAALNHQEADRVPRLLLFAVHGAKEIGVPIREYFASPVQVIRAQLQLREKYRNDCVYNFSYAAREIEAWGGEVVYYDDGPPNAGQPIVSGAKTVFSLEVPSVDECPALQKVLEVTAGLRRAVGDTAPVLGVVMSPFSLPVMQLGFERYLEMLYSKPDEFQHLMAVNQEFTVAWANAQLKAGATALAYFNPLASPTMIEKTTYLSTGYPVDQSVIKRIQGPVAVHLASGSVMKVAEEIMDSGALALGFSCRDSVSDLKRLTAGRIALVGNLNAVEMVRWTEAQAEAAIRDLLAAAGPGGGLLVSDNHGEIPWQVPETVLRAVADALDKWGEYPLKWVD